MKEQRQLIEIYKRIAQLKREGIKMKDIASATHLAPSVLSALYATVLPVFCAKVELLGFDGALDEALSNVNNLSRKRLMGMLDELHVQVMQFQSQHSFAPVGLMHPFLQFLQNETEASSAKLGSLEGMYMSYSCSSSVRALKAEPFYFTVSEQAHCLTVGRKSVHNSIREGIGIIQEQQLLYLLFNAFREPNMSLTTIYLQLPFLENIHILRGLYLVPDYNKNPIARRIVLVKLSDSYSPETFAEIEARIIPNSELSEEQKLIYNYTCGQSDSIKMCTLPSPKLDFRDLQQEKNLLEKETD